MAATPAVGPYMAAPLSGGLDAASLAMVLTSVLKSVSDKPPSVAKELRAVTDPGHLPTWAITPTPLPILGQYVTCLGAGHVRGLAPKIASALTRATTAVEPQRLLTPFEDLSTVGGVSPVDYADRHRGLLERLLAAVLSIPVLQDSDQEAARYLMESIRFMAARSGVAQFQVAVSSFDTSVVPRDPSSLLLALAQAFLPPDVAGAGRRAYQEYLIKKCDLTDANSTPSLVLAQARRVAKEQYPNSTPQYQSDEAKYLFTDWVHRMGAAHSRHGPLFEPLRNKLSDNQFRTLDVKSWSDQILVYEQPGGVLADFVASLAPLRMMAPRPRDRQKPAPTIQSVFLGGQLTLGGAHLDDGDGPELWDEGDVSTDRMYNAAAWPAVSGARGSMKPIAFVGAVIGDPSMVPPELAALAADPKSVFYITPFQLTADKMDAAWVQLYGCSDLGPPPNTNGAERPWLQVEQICQAANLTLPAEFYTVGQGTRHVGGDSCFACRTLSQMLGYECKWYVHPADKAAPPGTPRKPFGRQHMYLHQVLKCAYALAFLHRLVRSDRDSGRGEINAKLFQQRA